MLYPFFTPPVTQIKGTGFYHLNSLTYSVKLKVFSCLNKDIFVNLQIWCYPEKNIIELEKCMKIVSWNVNGLRASLNKGFMDFFKAAEADIFCLQETKMQQGQADINLEGYEEYWNSAVKKGYSGTAVFSKLKANSVTLDLGKEEHGLEGRVINLEYDNFYLVNAYVPNSQRGLTRLGYRMTWQDDPTPGMRGFLHRSGRR